MQRVLFICTANYYRSRFAEAVFNHHAEQRSLDWRAFSRGLNINAVPEGNISKAAAVALEARGIGLHHSGPTRVQIAAGDLHGADLAIAMSEQEHRPMLVRAFPDHVENVVFWDVDDLPLLSSEEALPKIERQVLGLLNGLASGRLAR